MANLWSNMLFQVKKEKLMSISSVVVMTVTFLLLCLFINIVVFSQTALKYLEQQAQITIFFKDDYTADKIQQLKSTLEKDPKIQEVKYISKEDALRIFKEMNKNEPILLESISASILPASLEIKAKNISDLKNLSEGFKKLDGVEEVRFYEDVVQRFAQFSHVVYILGFILVVLFLGISYSVVMGTIRTMIASKGPELEVMKLVGASDDYVKRPFLQQGVFYGLISSTIAAVINIVLGLTVDKLSVFSKGFSFGYLPGYFINPTIFAVILSFLLILSGFILGYAGSITAIKKYLKY